MRLFCWFCHKSVSNEVPDETIVRAICICPECIPSQLRADQPPPPEWAEV